MRLTSDPHIHPLVFPRRSQSFRKSTRRFNDKLEESLEEANLENDRTWHWAKHNPEDHWVGVRKYERPQHKFCAETPHIREAMDLYCSYILPFSYSLCASTHEETIEYMIAVGHTSCGVSKGSTRDWGKDPFKALLLKKLFELGPRFYAWFSDLTKEEVRKIIKATRNVNVAYMLYKYVGFRLFMKFKVATMAHCGEDHSSIGIDPFYGGWEKLYSQFINPSAVDMVSMDSTLCEFVLHFIYEVRSEFGFWTDLERQWLWWFYQNTVHSYIMMFDGSVYVKEHGMPSGSPMTSRDDTDYSIFCVCYDQAVSGLRYPFQCFGDNSLIDRPYEDFVNSFKGLGVDYTDEKGDFLGRRLARLKDDNHCIVSFLPSQFSKHVAALEEANAEVWKHLLAVTAHARNWALSKQHYDFFKSYFEKVVAQVVAEGEENILIDHKIIMPSWASCLLLHSPPD
jgi:hypothetical protein